MCLCGPCGCVVRAVRAATWPDPLITYGPCGPCGSHHVWSVWLSSRVVRMAFITYGPCGPCGSHHIMVRVVRVALITYGLCGPCGSHHIWSVWSVWLSSRVVRVVRVVRVALIACGSCGPCGPCGSHHVWSMWSVWLSSPAVSPLQVSDSTATETTLKRKQKFDAVSGGTTGESQVAYTRRVHVVYTRRAHRYTPIHMHASALCVLTHSLTHRFGVRKSRFVAPPVVIPVSPLPTGWRSRLAARRFAGETPEASRTLQGRPVTVRDRRRGSRSRGRMSPRGQGGRAPMAGKEMRCCVG